MGSKKNNSKKNKEPKNDNTTGVSQVGVGEHGGTKISTDPRFASVHLDPRFAKLPKHKAKVTIDSRFDKMFTDKNFASSTAQIDKRGKAKKDSSRDALKHYYRLEEEEEDRREKPKESNEVEEESDDREVELKKPSVDLFDLEIGTDSDASESDEEDESNDESADTEEEYEDGLYSGEEDTFVPDENVPEIDKETHRLAVVNLDWGRVKAVDLYVLFSSFLRKGGQVFSVAVYPSEFGLQRMEEEAKHGPVGLFDDENDKSGSDDNEDDDEIDNEKLRSYERSRLRYYYAVVECDSVTTADYLYRTCDGVEFEQTSNKLDLRFIPDSMEFRHPPREVAKEAPANYERLDFTTRALQMSKIELTWDEDEPQRTRTLKRKFNDEQLADLEMKEFLASDESEADEDENENDATTDQCEKKHKKRDKYRALLRSGEGSDEGDEDGDQDMEVTFNTGLEDLSKRILEKKDTKSETVWEQHLKKMKEKKKARRTRSKNSSEDESDDDDDEPAEEKDDFFVDESSVKGCKAKGKKNKEVDKEAEEKSKAELELLLVDENGGDTSVKGYNMKRRKVNGKKGREIPNWGKIPTIDYEDPRFSSLFTSPLFALDPTDPQFKRSAAYARQLTQKQQMGEEDEPIIKPHRPNQLESDDVAINKKEKKDEQELSSLVKSIKMKSKQVHLPPSGKVSRKTTSSKKSLA